MLTGSVAGIAYFVAKAKFLPRVQPDKEFRWDYDYVELGEAQDPYAYGISSNLYDEFHPANSDIEEWAVGSSSSYSSGGRSPSTGARSPVDDAQSLWEGDTLASTSDHEQVR